MNPFALARFALKAASQVGSILEKKQQEKRLAQYKREVPKLYERLGAAEQKFGWDLSEEEAQNALAYFLEQNGGDPLSAWQEYIASLERGVRFPATPETLRRAGYHFRKSCGKHRTNADDLIFTRTVERSFLALLGLALCVGTLIFGVRSGNVVTATIGFVASCLGIVYCLGRVVRGLA